ncbi:MAG TPA: Asp-tRNA(Asn)/Glu-tRNA(Gln) amidotransferase subunit GatB [Candidatus Saccharimonadales bacterium]|nr:Asp-tRNA(Asn)/Glu-tRNA(Gln) amidotransferase subunit GatB [Candidatus Saccharimonadales bacterium]
MKPSSKTYYPTIGIECHVQLNTKTKLFSAVPNDPTETAPNSLISPVVMGMPGALPVLNEKAVELAARIAFTLDTKPQSFSKFDRKHYFYPDLPKGYQITQYDEPIIKGGLVEISVNGETKKVRINRVHIEEDAGKTIHPKGASYSLVDLNRAGVPLVEIVSEPDMHSKEEARAFAYELYLLMRYSGVSEADLYLGNMRFDVNVSLSSDPSELGTRSETKNLNSFRSVEKAVEYEIKRQSGILDRGEKVVQETRGWDEARLKTVSERSKEDAHDYRYFPDPDLPPLELSEAYISKVKAQLGILPKDVRRELGKLELDSSAVETIVSEVLTGQFMVELVGEVSADVAKRIANWLATDVQYLITSGELKWGEVKLDKTNFTKLAEATLSGKLNSSAAKTILVEMIKTKENPMKIAESKQLLQMSDESEIEKIVDEVIKTNPDALADLKSGKLQALGFLTGEVMRLSKGRADPKVAKNLISKRVT